MRDDLLTLAYTYMACKYKRARSPFWWIMTKDGRAWSSKLRWSVVHETQKANDLLESIIRKEQQVFTNPERWEFWVSNYINERYEDSPKSLERYKLRWRSIRAFLSMREIIYPRQLTFNVMADYLAWRRKGDRAFGVWPVSRNTAIGDVKFFSLLLRRAIQLGFADTNPCAGLGLKKSKPEEKPEITDEHFAMIVSKLQEMPAWMFINFAICYYTGCRLREASVPLSGVDLDNRFIHFPDTKGDKPFTVPIRDELMPLLTRLKLEKRLRTFEIPPRPSLAFWKFFKAIGLGQYCVHCCRVTFITKGARAGVPERDMMRLVNHASEEIHRIYRRSHPKDLTPLLQKICLPSLPTHDSERAAKQVKIPVKL